MTVLSLQVSSGSDDGTFDGSSCGTAGSTTVGKFLTTVFDALTRFLLVTIPQASVINSAVMEVFALTSGTNNLTLREVRGHADDNAPAFTGGDCYTGRTQTVAAVPWIGVWPASSVQLSPDLAAIVQEIIDRPGWVSGNAMVIFINNDEPGFVARFDNIESFDIAPALAAKLTIDYTAPALPVVVVADDQCEDLQEAVSQTLPDPSGFVKSPSGGHLWDL